MAIICYAGLPGAGKSYSVIANVVIPALRERRHLVHNLKLDVDALQVAADPRDGKPYNVRDLIHELPSDANAQQVVDLSRPGAVIVLDEVWQYWPAGTKANEVPPSHLEYFKKHRHRVDEDTGHASEIVVIDQDPQTGIPAFLRSLIDLTYLHEKLDKVGAKGKFRVEVYKRAQSAMKPSKAAHIRSLLGEYKPSVWNCYQSHTESKRPDEAGLEVAPDQRGTIWGSWTMKAAIGGVLALPFALWLAYSSVQGIAGKKGSPEQVSERERPATLAKPVPVALTPVVVPGVDVPASTASAASELAPAGPIEPAQNPSPTWRLLGVITRGERLMAVLTNSGGRRTLDSQDCEPFGGDWRCRVEDGWAYYWSGRQVGLSAALPDGAGSGGTPAIPNPNKS